jgi:hypothetical protein
VRACSLTADLDRLSVAMDIAAVHANGCPLRLDDILTGDTYHFVCDVDGLIRHLALTNHPGRTKGDCASILNFCHLTAFPREQLRTELAFCQRSAGGERVGPNSARHVVENDDRRADGTDRSHDCVTARAELTTFAVRAV